MLVENTRTPWQRTRANTSAAPTAEPLDEFKKRLQETVERFRGQPVTPQSFLHLENEFHAAAQEACRQLLEREVNRLESDDSVLGRKRGRGPLF